MKNRLIEKELTTVMEIKYNYFFIFKFMFISCIGGFLFGYNTGNVGGSNLYTTFDGMELTNNEKQKVVSVAILTAAFGSLIGGPLMDNMGRKLIILLSGFLYLIGSIQLHLCTDVMGIVIGRFMIGLGLGTSSQAIPIYISEMAVPQIRGQLITIYNLTINFGQLVAYIVALIAQPNWRFMLSSTVYPVSLQIILLSLFLPETPKYLMKVQRYQQAEQTYQQVVTQDSQIAKLYIQKELSVIQGLIKEQQDNTYFKQSQELFFKYRRILFIGCFLQIFQQLSGVNTILYYGPEMLRQSGLIAASNQKHIILQASLPFASVNMIGNIFTLLFIDRLGRKSLMLICLPFCIIGMIGISIGTILTFKYDSEILGIIVNLSSMNVYIFAFALGLSATPWTINSEIYPLHLRGLGSSISTFNKWFINYLVSAIFLYFTEDIDTRIMTYLVFALFNFIFMLFLIFFVPETKGKTVEQCVDIILNRKKESQV